MFDQKNSKWGTLENFGKEEPFGKQFVSAHGEGGSRNKRVDPPTTPRFPGANTQKTRIFFLYSS